MLSATLLAGALEKASMRTFCLNGPVKKKCAVTRDVKVAAATLRDRVVVWVGTRIVKAGRTGRRSEGRRTREAIVRSGLEDREVVYLE